jgi:hypothetical protein
LSPKFVLSMIALVLGGVALRIAYEAHKPRIGTRVLFVGNSNTFVDKPPRKRGAQVAGWLDRRLADQHQINRP